MLLRCPSCKIIGAYSIEHENYGPFTMQCLSCLFEGPDAVFLEAPLEDMPDAFLNVGILPV